MTTEATLTDCHALRARRARATSSGMFLQESAADDIEDRLRVVNRQFTLPAVVTPFPGVWAGRMPEARIVPDNEVLDLLPGAHDLVIHALGLHWANDPVGQLIQCRRALKPDGLLIAACFGGRTLEELRACLGAAEAAVTGGLSPRVLPMGDIRDWGALLQRAGLALPVADSQSLTVEYRDTRHLMHDLRAMGETGALAARHRAIPPRGLFVETERLYAERFATASGRIAATFETVFLTGWAPGPGQPQPLRRGSATTRLAEALRVPEVPLDD